MRDEQKARTHENILHSAELLLRRSGIAGARVADVMKDAGLTVGGFYAHFASKTELIDHTIRRTGVGLRARLFHGLDAKPAGARAVVVLKRYLSAAHRDAVSGSDRARLGCPFPAIVGEVATTAPEHANVLAEQVDAFAIELAKYAQGRPLALGLVALMYGGLTLARATRGTPLSDEILSACRAVGEHALSSLEEKS